MNNKRIFPLFAAVILLVASLACNVEASSPPTATPNPPTIQALESPSPTPTVETKPSGGVAVSLSGVSFTIPTGIASSAGAESVAAVDDQGGPGWDVAPAHVKFSLQNYPVNGTMLQPEIYVYPAAEYEKVSAGAAESLKRLRALTSGAGMDINNNTVPFVPFFNAGQIFEAQARPLKFQNGSGIRMITQYDQAFMLVNNDELIYHFEGLTGDGKYYVIAIFPMTHPTLAATNDYNAPVPAGGVPFNQGDPAVYYAAVTQSLNNAAPESFTPSLTTLDALIQSLNVVAP
ncbi:MAG: hypothetical protein WA821_23125 [Anaerolineales bacterium]